MVSESKQKRVAYRQQVVRRLPLALLCAAALSFTLFLFTPMDIYAGNRTEFLFSFTDMGGWLLALALVGTMLFGALIALTPRRVSAVIAAVVFWLGVMGYAQGMFLNIGLKSLLGDGGAGDTPLWLYILDTALWVAAGVAAVLGALNMERKSWIRTAAGIALVVVLGMQVVGSVSIFGKVFARDNAAAGTSAAAGAASEAPSAGLTGDGVRLDALNSRAKETGKSREKTGDNKDKDRHSDREKPGAQKETLKNRGLKTHFEFLIPDFAVPLRTNRRLFQPSFAVLPNEARTASMAALRKPFLSNAATPSMVVPPGLHTASFNSPGCFPVSSTMAALPRSMAAA